MIQTVLYKRDNAYIGFSIKGHAGYADFGSDIVCASVTSAVMLVINGITEILKVNADITVLENEIAIKLAQPNAQAENFLKAFNLHIGCLAEDYEGTIKITKVEV